MSPAKGPVDSGESLIELLVAIMIMGAGVVVLLGGLSTAIRVSDIHRKQAVASSDVRAFAEALEAAVAQTPSAYVDCASPASYAAVYDPPEPRYTPEVVSLTYWNGTAFVATCGTDTGIQQVTLMVRSDDNFATEKLSVIIRKPCRTGDSPCA